MRVLVVTTWFPSKASDHVAPFVVRDATALSAQHEVLVLHLYPRSAGAHPGTEFFRDLRTERMPMRVTSIAQTLRAASRIRQLAKGADIVHSMAVSALPAVALAQVRVPWVHTEHWSGFVVRPPVSRVVGPAERLPDAVAAVSSELAARISEIRRGPVVVIPNIVEPSSRLGPIRARAPSSSCPSALSSRGRIRSPRSRQ